VNVATKKRTVEAGYDSVAEQYLATKDAGDTRTLTELKNLDSKLTKEAAILDLGCGAGIPATRWLSQRFSVTGVDISERQLELARRLIPRASFIKGDMTNLNFEPDAFDAVISLHAITHVPAAEQPVLLRDIYRWFKPAGLFLATWATGEWEGEEENWEGWGAPMWWSNLDSNANLKMLHDAGLVVESVRVLGDEDEQWMWVLARKPPRRAKR
jgi:ubiquinone/menaquinone biosynthesis C-methylase UbiE